MGALPQPAVPEAPLARLFERLHELHHRAGWPSLRTMAKEIGCSPTTVSVAMSQPRLPRWGMVELIVETLGGDVEEFHGLWLAASGTAARPALTEPVIPRQLPGTVSMFNGRETEFAQLDAALASRAGLVIAGTAGVGKTALAVQWAHRVAAEFVDGQLYIDMHGYDSVRPMSTASALESLLRSLGVDGAAVPEEQAERAAKYRTYLAGKRVLVVVDNARSPEQVRDLLPGGAGCFVVVTSRDSMRGLIARHGLARVDLGLLSAAESVELLERLIGDRVTAEPEQSAILAERCAHLPLALRIAAELAVSRPRLSLAQLNRELGEKSARLATLSRGDDDYSAVRTVMSWSLAHLGERALRLFRSLGLHPSRDIEVAAAAQLLGEPMEPTVTALDELIRAHLIDDNDGRVSMHDLLRDYSVELAAQLSPAETSAARHRLHAYLLDSAAAARAALFPHLANVEVRGPVSDAAAGRDWLAAEWPTLVSVAEDEPRLAPAISTLLGEYLDDRALFDAGLALHCLALDAAEAAGDSAGAGWALVQLATIDHVQGRLEAAGQRWRRAVELFAAAGDRRGEGRALHGLGTMYWRRGDYHRAHATLTAAVEILAEAGDASDLGNARYGLGIASRRLGRYAEAEAHHGAAIRALQDVGDIAGEGRARNNLGMVHLYLGRYQAAEAEFRRSLEIHEELDVRRSQAVALDNLGTTLRKLGRPGEALGYYDRALAIHRDIGYRIGEGDARRGIGSTLGELGLTGEAIAELHRAIELGREIGEIEVTTGAFTDLGEIQLGAGMVGDARDSFAEALVLSDLADDPYYRARALAGSAAAHHAGGDTAAAAAQWRQALEIFDSIGLPDATAVRAALRAAGLDQDTAHRTP